MARIEVSGLGELILSLEEMERLPTEVAKEMLFAGAEPVVEAINAEYRAQGLVDKGTLSESAKPAANIGLSNGGGKTLDVYPQGTNHTYKARSDSAKDTKKRFKHERGADVEVSNAEVAFIHEFGAETRHIKPTQSIRIATEKSADKAVAKEEDVYNAWLDSLGL